MLNMGFIIYFPWSKIAGVRWCHDVPHKTVDISKLIDHGKIKTEQLYKSVVSWVELSWVKLSVENSAHLSSPV